MDEKRKCYHCSKLISVYKLRNINNGNNDNDELVCEDCLELWVDTAYRDDEEY